MLGGKKKRKKIFKRMKGKEKTLAGYFLNRSITQDEMQDMISIDNQGVILNF